MGWYAFLLNHVIRPYLPLLFPDVTITGFLFEAGEEKEDLLYKKQQDPRRYFTDTGLVYRDNIEELAYQVLVKAEGRVEYRLQRIYDEIVVDEAQDISRYGLEVIKKLLQQGHVPCLLVGDSRQSLLDSSLKSPKNKKADRLNLLDWYRQLDLSVLDICEKAETYRFNQTIADFSDSIFPDEYGFTRTTSRMNERTGHDGVFLISEDDLDAYYKEFKPIVLRRSKDSWKECDSFDPINFGVSKGRTYERVAVLATEPIRDFICKGRPLKGKAACAFYVAVTRAKYSVAVVVKAVRSNCLAPAITNVEVWSAHYCPSLFDGNEHLLKVGM